MTPKSIKSSFSQWFLFTPALTASLRGNATSESLLCQPTNQLFEPGQFSSFQPPDKHEHHNAYAQIGQGGACESFFLRPEEHSMEKGFLEDGRDKRSSGKGNEYNNTSNKHRHHNTSVLDTWDTLQESHQLLVII
ncbi:hypothetical protein BKA65DRAFT_509357, partial [Rhexocercosporidium sp. MPI-PUGE-AT-0058]